MTARTRRILGNRIRELRKANNLSQQKLAYMVNVERSYLAKVEQGKRNPSIDFVEKVADGLGIRLSDLFAGIEAEADGSPAKNAAWAKEQRASRAYAVVGSHSDEFERSTQW